MKSWPHRTCPACRQRVAITPHGRWRYHLVYDPLASPVLRVCELARKKVADEPTAAAAGYAITEDVP